MVLQIKLGHDGPGRFEHSEEYEALMAEFEAWEPELAEISRADANHFEQEAVNMRQERDEARQTVRELLEDADPDDWDEHRMQKRYPWLKESDGKSSRD